MYGIRKLNYIIPEFRNKLPARIQDLYVKRKRKDKVKKYLLLLWVDKLSVDFEQYRCVH